MADFFLPLPTPRNGYYPNFKRPWADTQARGGTRSGKQRRCEAGPPDPLPPSIRSSFFEKDTPFHSQHGATYVKFLVPCHSQNKHFYGALLKLTQKYTSPSSFWPEMAHNAENFKSPLHSRLHFDTPLVWCLIFRAPSIQLL